MSPVENNDLLVAEIDLRKLIKAVLAYKVYILVVVILSVLLGYLAGSVLLQKVYSSTAYVIITELSFNATLEERIETSQGLPDVNSLTDLVIVDRVLEGVYQKVSQTPEGSAIRSPSDLKGLMDMRLVGGNQLRLTATTPDPSLSMVLVNTWSEELVALLNSLIGIDENQLMHAREQKAQAYANWENAEQALAEADLDSNITLLEVSLEEFKLEYGENLKKINLLRMIISDGQTLKRRMEALPENQSLSIDEKLGLTLLQQRATGGEIDLTFQFSEALDTESDTVGQARRELDTFIASLEEQVGEVQNGLALLEEQIAVTQNDLLDATRSREKLATERDVALNSYQALANEEEEMRILQSKNNAVAKIASYAILPPQPSGLSAVKLALITGALGLAISIFVVLFRSWWISSDKEVEEVYPVKIPDPTIQKASMTKE